MQTHSEVLLLPANRTGSCPDWWVRSRFRSSASRCVVRTSGGVNAAAAAAGRWAFGGGQAAKLLGAFGSPGRQRGRVAQREISIVSVQ